MTLLLLAHAYGEETGACVDPEVPRLTLSETELDFGYVPLGERAERIVTLSNTGTAPLAVTDIAIAVEPPDFDVEIGDADCVSIEEFPDTGEDTASAGRTVWVLAPGCAVSLTVGYTPVTSDTAQNALVVRSEAWRSVQADPIHAHLGVWLSGQTDPSDVPAPAVYVVGKYIALERTAIHELESVGLEVRTVPEDVTILWTARGSIDDDSSSPTYTAGVVDGCGPTLGSNADIYAVIQGVDGSQDWAFSKLAVWDAVATLEVCPEATCSEDDTAGDDDTDDDDDDDEGGVIDRLGGACGCSGCSGSAGGAAFAIGLFGLTRRRRR